MNKSELVAAWIKKAESDLKNIENNLSFTDEEIPIDTVCFHFQQAIEKMIKAFLTSKELEFPYTHNLGSLVQIAQEVDKSFFEIKERVEIFSPFAVEIRYPDNSELPSVDECRELFQSVLEIKKFIIDKI